MPGPEIDLDALKAAQGGSPPPIDLDALKASSKGFTSGDLSLGDLKEGAGDIGVGGLGPLAHPVDAYTALAKSGGDTTGSLAPMGLGSVPDSVVGLIKSVIQAHKNEYDKSMDPSRGIIERLAHGSAALTPVVGPAVSAAAEEMGTGAGRAQSGDPEGIRQLRRGLGAAVASILAARGLASKGVPSEAPPLPRGPELNFKPTPVEGEWTHPNAPSAPSPEDIPPPPPSTSQPPAGMIRLYRGISSAGKPLDVKESGVGSYWTDSAEMTKQYGDKQVYIDLPVDEVRKYNTNRGASYSPGRNDTYILPPEVTGGVKGTQVGGSIPQPPPGSPTPVEEVGKVPPEAQAPLDAVKAQARKFSIEDHPDIPPDHPIHDSNGPGQYVDPLTSIPNRRGFLRSFDDWKAQNPDQPYTVVHSDLRGLKQINDTLGQVAGDAALKAYSALAQKLASKYGGFVARMGEGADEYVSVVPAEAKEAYLKELDASSLGAEVIHPSTGIKFNLFGARSGAGADLKTASDALADAKAAEVGSGLPNAQERVDILRAGRGGSANGANAEAAGGPAAGTVALTKSGGGEVVPNGATGGSGSIGDTGDPEPQGAASAGQGQGPAIPQPPRGGPNPPPVGGPAESVAQSPPEITGIPDFLRRMFARGVFRPTPTTRDATADAAGLYLSERNLPTTSQGVADWATRELPGAEADKQAALAKVGDQPVNAANLREAINKARAFATDRTGAPYPGAGPTLALSDEFNETLKRLQDPNGNISTTDLAKWQKFTADRLRNSFGKDDPTITPLLRMHSAMLNDLRSAQGPEAAAIIMRQHYLLDAQKFATRAANLPAQGSLLTHVVGGAAGSALGSAVGHPYIGLAVGAAAAKNLLGNSWFRSLPPVVGTAVVKALSIGNFQEAAQMLKTATLAGSQIPEQKEEEPSLAR